MGAKGLTNINKIKSPIYENTNAKITCDFGDDRCRIATARLENDIFVKTNLHTARIVVYNNPSTQLALVQRTHNRTVHYSKGVRWSSGLERWLGLATGRVIFFLSMLRAWAVFNCYNYRL